MSLLLQCRQLGNTAGTKPLFTRADLSISTKHGIEASMSRVRCKEFSGTHTLKIRRPENCGVAWKFLYWSPIRVVFDSQ